MVLTPAKAGKPTEEPTSWRTPAKSPTLRQKSVKGISYYTAEVYKPTTLSFGSAKGARGVGDIYTAFGKWVKLYEANPHRTLSFESPQEAVAQMDEPASIITVGDLADHYTRYADSAFKVTSSSKLNPHYHRLTVGLRMMEPYRAGPIKNFGPAELRSVSDSKHAVRARSCRRRSNTLDSMPAG